MKPQLLPVLKAERPSPIVLAFPRVYKNLYDPAWRCAFARIMTKCYELADDRPSPKDQVAGYLGLGWGDRQRLRLYTVWAVEPSAPDIFILSGTSDGWGPGHTCPSKEELRRGIYGELKPVPLL